MRIYRQLRETSTHAFTEEHCNSKNVKHNWTCEIRSNVSMHKKMKRQSFAIMNLDCYPTVIYACNEWNNERKRVKNVLVLCQTSLNLIGTAVNLMKVETSKVKQTVIDGEVDSCCLWARRMWTKSYSFNFSLHSIISSCTSKTLTMESVLSSSDLLYKSSHSVFKITFTLFNTFTLLHQH